MVLVITETERNERGTLETYVSHGIDLATGQTVVLPQVHPEQIAVYHPEYGEYVIMDEGENNNDY